MPPAKSKQGGSDNTAAFLKAAIKGDVAKLQTLLTAGQKCDTRDHVGKTALMLAAEKERMDAVRILLQAGADAAATVSDRDSIWFGCNALVFAAQNDRSELIKLLLDAGASPKCQASDETTPLTLAIEHRSLRMVELMLAAGAPLAKDILVASVWNSSPEISLRLIQAGANVNACNDLGQSVLHRAAENGQTELVRAFIRAKAKLNTKSSGTTPLLIAIQNNQKECAIELIRAGADSTITGLLGRNALMLAALSNQIDVVEALVKAGADCNAKDRQGKTALMLANEKSHTEVIKLLRATGSDESGYQILEYLRAAEKGDLEQVRHFLDAGVDVNVRYQNGATAMMSAIAKGHTEVVRLLLERGANAGTSSTAKAWGAKFHADALGWAAESGQLEIVRLLLKSGADANKSWMITMSALEAAARRGHTEIVRELLKAGHSIKGQAGRDALDSAIYKKHEDAAVALIEAGVDVKGKSAAEFLVDAAENGLARVVKALLKAGVDPKLRNEFDQTALQAAEAAKHKAIANLLRKAASPQAAPSLELVEAAERGDSRTVRRMILEGVGLESRDSKGATALMRASANGHLPVIQALLAAGADPNATTQFKPRDNKKWLYHMEVTAETPLSCAVSAQSLPTVELLLQAGADIKRTECGHLACMMLKYGKPADAFVERLLDAGMSPHAKWPVINVSLLEMAAQENFVGLVEKLLRLGARLQNSNERNRIILDTVQRKRYEIAELLIECGTAPGVKGAITTEALVCAAQNGADEIVRALLKSGVKVNGRADASFDAEGSVEGVTGLMAAARHGHISTVELLLKAGANPNTEDPVRRTALDWAGYNKNSKVAGKIHRILEAAAGN